MGLRQGDIIYVEFTPTLGREQSGNRPCVVISRTEYNEKTGFFLSCPITSTVRSMNIRVHLDERTETQGDILCEQIRTMDSTVRKFTYKERLPYDLLCKILEVIKGITSPDKY
jgi:mRNA-degrading endonuclease toxin of MazEF toxin-antitoxin module